MKPAVDVKAAVSALRKGGVIACPTEAVWGLSCDPDNDEALAHLMRMKERDPAKGVLLITHYQRLLDVVKPDKVSILSQGRIVRTGGPELAIELENEGYDAVMAEAA